MFRGVHYINMDAKGRLAMPARHREPLLSLCGGHIVVTVDTLSRCLAIYPLPEWERIERDIQALPSLKPQVKRFQRLLIGHASDLELDGNGRLVLPAPLREYARLNKKLVLVGQVNKIELWAEELWVEENVQELEPPGPDTQWPDEMMSLTL